MKTKSLLLIFAIPVVMGLATVISFVLFFGIVLWRSDANSKKLTAETTSVIIDASECLSCGSGKTRELHYLYKYVVNGKEYKKTSLSFESLENAKKKIGSEGRVCYNPAEPSQAEFYFPQDKWKVCGQ